MEFAWLSPRWTGESKLPAWRRMVGILTVLPRHPVIVSAYDYLIIPYEVNSDFADTYFSLSRGCMDTVGSVAKTRLPAHCAPLRGDIL
jgi:hypothetical protein